MLSAARGGSGRPRPRGRRPARRPRRSGGGGRGRAVAWALTQLPRHPAVVDRLTAEIDRQLGPRGRVQALRCRAGPDVRPRRRSRYRARRPRARSQRNRFSAQGDAANVGFNVNAGEHPPATHAHGRPDVMTTLLMVGRDHPKRGGHERVVFVRQRDGAQRHAARMPEAPDARPGLFRAWALLDSPGGQEATLRGGRSRRCAPASASKPERPHS